MFQVKPEEANADVVIRKGKKDFRFYPQNERTTHFLASHHPPGDLWKTLNDTSALMLTRRATSAMIHVLLTHDYKVAGNVLKELGFSHALPDTAKV